MDWADTARGRGARERQAAVPVPQALPLLDTGQRALLQRWARGDSAQRKRATLLGETGVQSIEQAEALCERLLSDGWIARHERLVGGHWQWESIAWRDLPRLQQLLGIAGPAERRARRTQQLADAQAWMQARSQATDRPPDPDLLDELGRALEQLAGDTGLRADALDNRLALLRALVDWHDAGAQGTRRDFALRARGGTKALGEADWRWLQSQFDLERLRITRFVPLAWLAGDLRLHWDDQAVDLRALHCAGLPLADLDRASAASGPARWWLLENRASFERQAQQRVPGLALLWLPGRPSAAWLDTVSHLLALAPAPAWISADADPAGVDIACTAGARWRDRGLAWEAHQMGPAELQATAQHWPLNTHDRQLLARLLQRAELPATLRTLCEAMQQTGRKAEQEGWL